MARIKKYSPLQNLSSFQTFITDENPNSDYFRITEFKDTFTGGKNGFLIEGSEYLKESTEIKVEILDVNGDPIYYEPGNGIPEYYEGISKLIAVYIYNDTPIGLGKITVLGELKQYDDNGVIRQIPDQWKGSYNVKWERTFQINKNISNEDRVRFYKRPKVTIDEINKPIFSNNSRLVTKTGTVDGIPLVPVENTNLSNFSLPTSYRLKVKTGDNWTGSIEGDPITFDNIDYNPIVEEVINKTEIIVTPPYSEGGLVKSFTDENYSLTFPYLEGINDLATALTGSFAKIKITDMKTFVGDAARVKIFRRSQSNVTDFEFVQEIQLESNELLRDIETFAAPEELYGFFTEPIIEEYWVTSSNDLTVSLNQDFLYNSAKLNSSGNNLFFTTRSLDIENDIEYSLDFNVRKGSLVAGEKITAFLSGSLNNVAKSQTIIEIPSSNGVLQKTNYNENFIADEFDEAKLYFDVNGSDWYINNLSLKASQETSFSPDVITFIQNVPKTLAVETFDYRFEFYDINNNFIPVLVEATKRFDGGNLNLFEKSLVIEPSNLYFTFDSASFPSNPLPPTSIIFDIETTLITGSIFFTSGAYDEFGNFLSASEYAGGQYPGLLRNIDSRTPVLNVADFTGSRDDITVQYIRFTGFAEGVSDEVVITRVKDGKGGVNFEIIPFRGTSIKNKSDKDLEIQAYRIDGINRIELKDNLPQTGFSDAKLRVLSSSIDPITSDVSSSYFLLSEASSNGFLSGISAGTTGSGEIDYNATFNRDAIDNELTVYLMDGPTSESILTSIILNDLQDGLASGFISFDAEQFGIKPRDERVFTPQIGRVTGSFYLRGTNSNPISGTLDIYPSMSVDPDTKEPFYYMFYVTDSFDRRIDIVVTDKDNNIVDSGRPGEEVSYFVPTERKQLTTTFTYTEDITSASISVDKTFFSVPDGLPGADSIIVDIDPRPVVLNADQRGNVFNYSNADTTITVTQGRLPLIFNDTKKPGTFTTSSITPLGIEYTTFDEVLGDATMSLSGFQRMVDLTASVTYDLEIHPYFTASFYTQSFVQQFKKTLEGADAINIELDPVSVTIDAEENGGITDFSAANTTLRVKQGDTYMEFSTSSLVLPGTFSASLSPNQISVGTFSSSNDNSTERNLDDTLHFRDFNNFLTDSGSIDYQITIYPFSITNGILSGSQTVNRKQLFSKNKEGIRARSVELTTTTEVANYDKDGIITSPVDPVSGEPTSIFLTATAFNITSSQAYYEFFQEGFAVTFPGTNNQFEVGSGDLPSPGTTTTYRVDLRDGSTSGPVFASKEVTISGIQSGANNYQVFLTNPSPTITVKVDGELDLSTTGTQIKAFKGTEELTHVQNYSQQQLDNVGDPIGTLGEFSSSLFFIDSYIGQSSYPQGNPAAIPSLSDWTLPQDNPTATAIYKVDIENGRATYFLSQSFAATFEGDVGPGLVFRGPWTGSIQYLYDKNSKRRDAVLYSESGNEPYDTYYATKDSGSSFTTFADSTPGAGDASEPTRPDGQGGREVNDDFWVSLGQEEFFVAAKLAIFEQSFVKETINVGTPPPGNQNANIAIVGGTDEPYIAVGQTGTQGFRQPGVFIGMSNDYGSSGTSGTTGIMSLKSDDSGGTYNSLEWDGETLTIRGAIRQTSAGVREGALQGLWSDAASSFTFVVNDIVSHNGKSWVCILQHVKNQSGSEPLTGGSYTTYWSLAADAGSSGTAGSGGSSGTAGTAGTSGAQGSNGAPGAGVVYRGEWTAEKDFFSTTERKDVVKSGSNYYISAQSTTWEGAWDSGTFYQTYSVVQYSSNYYINLSGTVSPGGSTPNVNASWTVYSSPTSPSGLWEAFGAQFESVATDILFATDVYADQTINIGAEAGGNPVIALNADAPTNENPFISIGQETQGFFLDGIFLGYAGGNPSFSIVTGSRFFEYSSGSIKLSDASFQGTGSTIIGSEIRVGQQANGEYSFTVDTDGIVSASEAFIQGTVQASAGKIGEWIIDEDTALLRDTTNEITLNPGVGGDPPGIKIFSASFDAVELKSPRSMSVFADNGRFLFGVGNNVTESNYTMHLLRSQFLPITPTQTKLSQQAQPSADGGSYYIDTSDPSMTGHLFSFSIREDGIGTYGGRYNKETSLDTSDIENQPFLIQTSSALPGNPGAYITIFPSSSMQVYGGTGTILGDYDDLSLANFYYYCENHTGMGGYVKTYEVGSNPVELVPLDPVERIRLDSVSTFSDTAAANATLSWSGSGTTSIGALQSDLSVTSNTTNRNTVSTSATSLPSNTPISVTAGSKIFSDITIPALTFSSNGMSAPSNPTISYPNYDPSYEGQIHGGISSYPQSQVRTATVTLQLINDDGDSVGASTLKSFYKYGPTNAYYNYTGVDSGGYNSVTGNTKIRLADGTTKLAKNITLDDKILSWDDINKKWVSASISHIHKRDIDKVYKVTLSNGNEIEVSDDHKFYLFGTEFNSGQVNVQTLYNALKNGDDLSQDGLKLWIKDNDSRTQVTVTNVEIIEREDDAITYTIPHYVNYLSNDIISHNAFPPGGDTISWSYEQISPATSGTGTQTSSSETVEKTINITEAGNIRARYKWEIGVRSGRTSSISANGTVTYSYNTDTNTFKTNTATANYTARFYSNGGYSYGAWDSSISLEVENNFVEIRPAGIQVVSNNDRFVRLARRELTDTNPDLFTVSDGTAYFYARGGSFPAAIVSDGDINPYSDSSYDLGSTGVRWANIYTDNINGLDASGLAVSATLPSGPATSTTDTNNVNSTYEAYVKIPGGVIIQWGHLYDTSSPRSVSFPTTFPNAVNSVVCSTQRSSDGSRGFNHVYNYDRSGADLVLDGDRGFWIAIGW